MNRILNLICAFVLVFSGAVAVQWFPLWGHILIAAGLLLAIFSPVCARDFPADDSLPCTVRGRWLLYSAVLMLTVASAASIIRPEDRAIAFWLWLAGSILILLWALRGILSGLRIGKAEIGTFVVPGLFLLVFASVVNFYLLGTIPRAVHGDVGEIALQARAMNPLTETLTVSTWASIPGLHNLIVKSGFLVSRGLAAARFSDALCGVLAALLLFITLRSWTRLPASIAGTVLFICSASLIHTFRVGLGLTPPILLSIAALLFFWKSQNSRSRTIEYSVLCGIVCGLSLQVNFAARVIPLLIVLFALHQAFFSRQWKAPLLSLTVTASVAALIAGPLLVYYLQHSELIDSREKILIFRGAGFAHASGVFNTESLAGVFFFSLLRSVGMFHFYPDPAYGDFFIGDTGFFEPLTAAFFLIGAILSLRLFRDSRYGWTLSAWFVSVSVLVAMTINAPAYHRAGPPALFASLLAGLGIDALLETGILSRRYLAVLFAVLISFVGTVWGIERYFFDYVNREFPNQNMMTSIAERILEEPRETTHVYLLGMPVFYFHHGTIRFIADGYKGEDILPGAPFPDIRSLADGTNLFVAIDSRAPELAKYAARLGPVCLESHKPKENPERGYKVYTIRISRDESNERKISVCDPPQ